MATQETQEKYADKIAKLLRKAENPAATPEEAEAFTAKAQELMTEYAITEELLAKARGVKEAEEVVEEKITYTGIFHQALFDIGNAVAKHNDCKTLISRMGNKTSLHIIGHKSDVERVKMLDTSLQIQAVGGLTRWWKDYDGKMYMTPTQKYRERRQFLFSFAQGVSVKLAVGRKAGEKNATKAAEERGDKTATDSVALVVRDKKARVQDWVDQKYGKTLRNVSRNYAGGGYGASNAGYQAGQRADVGTGGGVRGGSGKQLGR